MSGRLTLVAAVFAVASGFSASNGSEQPVLPAAEQAVAQRSLAFAKAALDGDLGAFSVFMTDDYIMLWPEPATKEQKARWEIKTKAELIREIGSKQTKYRSVELMNLRVYLHNEVATVTGDYAQTALRDGTDHTDTGPFTETWVKRGGQWLIVSSVFP
jgi:ketosteroid isomerase-like protein